MCAALQWHFSQMICLSLLLSLRSPSSCNYCVFVSLCPSVYSGQVFSLLSLPSKSSNLQNLLLSLHKASYVLLCVILVSLVSLIFWQSADRPASAFPPRPFTPPPDCNNVSKCGSARRWMGTLFNTTCHLSNPRLVTGGEERQSSELRCLWWEEALDACWASKTTFLCFNFT